MTRALEEVKGRLPFSLLGIDSDNDSAFLNGHLLAWCRKGGVEFTWCRPYRKNDQAHIEQKNWGAVRQLIGYDRYEGKRKRKLLREIYRSWGCWSGRRSGRKRGNGCRGYTFR